MIKKSDKTIEQNEKKVFNEQELIWDDEWFLMWLWFPSEKEESEIIEEYNKDGNTDIDSNKKLDENKLDDKKIVIDTKNKEKTEVNSKKFTVSKTSERLTNVNESWSQQRKFTVTKPDKTKNKNHSTYGNNESWNRKKQFEKKRFSNTRNTEWHVVKKNNTQVKEHGWSRKNTNTIHKPNVSPRTSVNLIKKESIEIGETITVKEFSEKMGVQLSELLKKFMLNKILVNVNSTIDYDTASLIWEELWVEVKKDSNTDWVSIDDLISWNLQSILDQDKEAHNKQIRPPVVTIMWHVDHWKTKLLDYIRKTKVATWEAWWITQSIWASQIEYRWNNITFIDTPWHELFTSLRARWAKITDIVIIVVAADEWIKQQTIEAIDHAKDAGVPIMVAINKIDKPNTNIDLVKSQLSEHWLVCEDRWWETVMVKVSAITWEWVDELLEMISLQSEMLDLQYNPDRNWVWVVVESNKDTKRWVTTSLIMMTWSLQVWDIVFVHNTFWKVRNMVDWKWDDVRKVKWWDPVMILWIQDIPEPWRFVEVVKSEKEANIKIDLIKEKEKTQQKQNSIQNILSKINQWENVLLKLILKADSYWSLEALKYVTSKIDLPENIELKLIHSDVWQITDSDIVFADASKAFVVWFNVWVNAQLKKKAEQLKVITKTFNIIYEIIDYIDRLANWLVKPEEKEVYIWKLDILWIFFKKWKEMIVWWKVVDWKIKNWSLFKIYRWEEIVWTWRITSLKKESENVSEIWEWHECWIKVKVSHKIQLWDKLEVFVIE